MRASTPIDGLAFAVALALAATAHPAIAQDERDWPRTIVCGLDAPTGEIDPVWGKELPDREFRADRDYGHVGGIVGRADAPFARDGRSWPVVWREGAVRYTLRAPPGRYLVDLAFIETETELAGERVFDVLIEGERRIGAVDIAREVGAYRWLFRAAAVETADGWIDLDLAPLTALPPRISRIGVRPLVDPGPTPRPPPTPTLLARPGIEEVVIAIAPSLGPRAAGGPEDVRIDGFSLLRSTSPDGPFESLSALPLRTTLYRDRSAEPGATYWYRAKAIGIDGTETPLSDAVSASPLGEDALTYRHYRLAVDPPFHAAILGHALSDLERARVPCRIGFLGQEHVAELGLGPRGIDVGIDLRIDMSADAHRVFQRRRLLLLESEARDPTRIREALTALAYERLGLAGARVEPVLISLGDSFLGFRQDIEHLDAAFRRRTRLDRNGPLISLTRPDRWQRGWEPYGELLGEAGDVVAFNYLVHELRRLHEGEMAALIADRLYLDRAIDRLAFGALRGELDAPAESRIFLRDSRNGRWEELRQLHRYGDWGIRGEGGEVIERLSDEDLERVLLPGAILPGHEPRGNELALWTRLLRSSELRERVFDRVTEWSAGPLAPSEVERLVDRLAGELGPGILVDPDAWPYGDERVFRERLDRLVAWYRAHVGDLHRTIVRLRERAPEPVVLSGYSLRPRGDDRPWIELWNRSDETIDLSRYSLSESIESEGGSLAAARSLSGGARVRVALASRSDGVDRATGGELVLWRKTGEAADANAVVADLVSHGWHTQGLVASLGMDLEWSYSLAGGDTTSIATPEALPASAFPSPRFDQGIEQGSRGELAIWFRPLGNVRSPDSIERLAIRVREVAPSSSANASGGEWREEALSWDAKELRYAIGLDAPRERALEYHFLLVAKNGLERAYPLGAPDVVYSVPILPPLRINEICPRPLRGSETGEFIEIHNAGDEPVSMRGLYLTDDQRVPAKWRISEDVIVPPKGYVVFYGDGRNQGRHASFKLSNSGEYLAIHTRHEAGMLRVDAQAFRGVPAGQSWGRREDGIGGFQIWKDPTPGARNMPKIPEEFLERRRRENAERQRSEGSTND